MVAALDENNTRYVWSDEETGLFLEFIHKTNKNSVLNDEKSNKMAQNGTIHQVQNLPASQCLPLQLYNDTFVTLLWVERIQMWIVCCQKIQKIILHFWRILVETQLESTHKLLYLSNYAVFDPWHGDV